jgi:hypothetical protein
VLDGARLVLTNTPIPTVEEVVAQEPWRSKFIDLLTILYGRYLQWSGKLDTERKRLTAALLDEIAKTSRAAGAAPIFVYLPVYNEIPRPEMDMSDGERFFFAYCRERNIRSINLQKYFYKKLKRGVALKTFDHWSPDEHLTAAEGIRDYLVENNLVPLFQSRPDSPLEEELEDSHEGLEEDRSD